MPSITESKTELWGSQLPPLHSSSQAAGRVRVHGHQTAPLRGVAADFLINVFHFFILGPRRIGPSPSISGSVCSVYSPGLAVSTCSRAGESSSWALRCTSIPGLGIQGIKSTKNASISSPSQLCAHQAVYRTGHLRKSRYPRSLPRSPTYMAALGSHHPVLTRKAGRSTPETMGWGEAGPWC